MFDFLKNEIRAKSKSFCSACGEETNFHSILICAECLNDESNKFASLFENSNDTPEEANIEE